MLEELLMFLIILVISIILSNIALNRRVVGPFYPITSRMAFMGVIIHELCHYVMCIIVGMRPENIKIKWWAEKTRIVQPHGSVRVKPRSFLQDFLITFAPLYLSTWLAMFFFYIAVYSSYLAPIRIIAGILLVSTIIGAAPSAGDMAFLFAVIRKDPIRTLYQIFLVILSIIILMVTLYLSKIVFFLDIFYYLSIAAIYWVLKLSIMGISKVIAIRQAKDIRSYHHLKVRRFARHRYKPQKPYKLGIEECW
ncbi:MAG: hypothetical protein ACFE9T_00975 [Promethearchaeota archaeon]